MAKVTIGGKEYTLAEMNFIAVELAYPFIEQAMQTVHPVQGTKAALAVIAAGLLECDDFIPAEFEIEALTYKDPGTGVEKPIPQEMLHEQVLNFLRRKLKANEMGDIKLALFEVLEEAGFEMAEVGELPKDLADLLANPSTETATDTSLSLLLPELKEDPGTASVEGGDSVATS